MRLCFLNLLFLLGYISSFSASLSGSKGLGEESWPLDAHRRSLGYSGEAFCDKKTYSLLNPARTAFNEKTSFSTTLDFGSTRINEKGQTGVQGNFKIPNINFAFATPYGTLGLSYWQRYVKNFQFKSPSSLDSLETSMEFKGGTSELAPSWATAFGRNFALGMIFHLIMGRETRYAEIPVSSPQQELYPNISKTTLFEKVEVRNLFSNESFWKRLSFSAQAHFKTWDAFLSSTMPYSFDREITSRSYLDNGDSLILPRDTVNQKMPLRIGGGVFYMPVPRWGVSMDIWKDFWETSAISIHNAPGFSVSAQQSANDELRVGAGVERFGSGRFYDPYLEKSSYRIGGTYQRMYLEKKDRFLATTGIGLPLGKSGAQADISLEGGWIGRLSDENSPPEYVMGISLSFTGISNWGQTSRRYR